MTKTKTDGKATKTTDVSATTSADPTLLTTFRVHFRKTDSDEAHKMDVDARNVGEAHDAVRKAHQTEDVRVFIDKVKVVGADDK
jgi:hypothetical protein